MSSAFEPGSERLRGECIVLLAVDVGRAVDLELAARLAAQGARMPRIESRARGTEEIQPRPAPWREREAKVQLELEHGVVEIERELWLYDFGGLSIVHRLPFEGTWHAWIELSCRLHASRKLIDGARARAEALVESIRGAVDQPHVDEGLEDYTIFRLAARAERGEAERLCATHAPLIAQLLRAEDAELSDQEIAESTAARVAFSSTDLAVVDWNGALLFDDEPDDIVAVLEFANLHLAEMRFLDRQLDRALDQAYDALIQRTHRGVIIPGTLERELSRISRHQVDAAILFERVNNAFKLYDDQYLARVYRQAAARLRLAEWNTTNLRKLDTLDDIYRKILDRAEARRMEFLEWIVIILIAISMILPLIWPGYVSHG